MVWSGGLGVADGGSTRKTAVSLTACLSRSMVPVTLYLAGLSAVQVAPTQVPPELMAKRVYAVTSPRSWPAAS